MDNIGSSDTNGRRRSHPLAPPPEITPNRYVFSAAMPYPTQYSHANPNGNPSLPPAVPKEKNEYKTRAMKQILWVNGTRYELQEIYGIGNSVDGHDVDGNDPGKERVICLSEPRDTTVLPCRHMVSVTW
ncbi:hypothetical protein SAY86_017653 [Trapa natans]|uniref:RING-type E3 ubiquitin transferase n=1 Tax=Trapa natans TaxID=22666 RepID=A0AAN7LSL2_TRANT|nr:hypothetical protein SAY86_017653 [Trapa natans]